jgi:protocatechuate 3,4-dioxygenase, beta subunit
VKLIAPIITALALARSLSAQEARIAPAGAPSRITMTSPTEPGTRLSVSGRVMGSDGRPVPDASLYVYQTDANGQYIPGQEGGSERPRLLGYLRSDSEGRYAFTTIKPGSYPNTRNPAHVHFEVTASGYETRIYEIVFEGDPFISTRFREQAAEPFGGVVVVSERATSSGLEVSHDIRVRVAAQR